MTFGAIDAWWWHFLFILIAGWLATDIWRWLGVWFGGRLRTDSESLVLVRIVATALIAGVIGNLVVYPSGQLAATPLALRIFAVALGFLTYVFAGRKTIVAILVAEAVMAGWFILS